MSGGFLALLDDVASTLSGIAAASAGNISSASKASLKHFDDVAGMIRIGSSKSSAIVVDDIPVNAQAVAETRVAPERELIVIGKIMRGSFLNKLAIIPAAIGVSALAPAAPWLLPAILAAGGAYLAYEGTEKTLEWLWPHGQHKKRALPARTPQELERKLISSALKTDVVMSAEIMFIALGAMSAASGILPTAIALTAIGALTTAGIYGLVGGLVKLDDVGLVLQGMEGNSLLAKAGRAVGPALVKSLPYIMKGLSCLGTGAMLYVGGALIGHALPAAEHLFHAAGNLGTHLPSFLSSIATPVGWFAKSCAEQAVGLAAGIGLITGAKYGGPIAAPAWDFAKKALRACRDAFTSDAAPDGPAPRPMLVPFAPIGLMPDIAYSLVIRPAAALSSDFPAAARDATTGARALPAASPSAPAPQLP